MNKLKEGYKDSLYRSVHEHYKNTLHIDYNYPVISGDENSIVRAIEWGTHIFPYVINPSDKVIAAGIVHRVYIPDIDSYKGNKVLDVAIIKREKSKYNDYPDDYFTNDEIMDIISYNPDVLKYIKNKTSNMVALGITRKPSVILDVDQTEENIIFALERTLSAKHVICLDIWCKICEYEWVNYIDYTKIKTKMSVVETLLIKLKVLNVSNTSSQLSLMTRIYKSLGSHVTDKLYIFTNFVKKYPESLTQGLCKEFFECNYMTIINIPHEYQDDEMISFIISSLFYGSLWKYLRINGEVRDVFTKCDYIEYIPKEYHTIEKITLSLERNIDNFKFARKDLLDKEILDRFFTSAKIKSTLTRNLRNIFNLPEIYISDETLSLFHSLQKGTPKKDRMKIIESEIRYGRLSKEFIQRLIIARPVLLGVVNKNKRHEYLTKLISENPYALSVLTEEEKNATGRFLVNLALQIEPKASKYV